MDRQSRRFSLRVALGGAAVTLAVSISAAPASGAVTFGSDLSESDFVNAACTMPTCTVFNGSLPAGRTLTSPITGVVVRWRLKQGNNSDPATFALRVLHPVTLGPPISQVTALATGAGELLPSPPGTYQFDTRLPITAGDTIGMNASNVHGAVATADVSEQVVEGPFPDNTTRMASHGYAAQLMLNADVETDLDRDVFGDETQDKCLGTAGAFNGCPSSITLGKVKQKGTKVKVTATVPGAGTLKAGSASNPGLASQAATSKSSLKTVTKTLTSTSPQQVVLTLKLTKAAKQKLALKGKLKLKVKAVYTPVGGPPGSQTKRTKLRS
jgi:hypothetical protein